MRDLEKGEIVNESDLVALRPQRGILANEGSEIYGKRALKPLKALSVLSKDDFA